jgi:tRNA pseudouridine32 synthase / 23S rRNA pseudouridine746 synthase
MQPESERIVFEDEHIVVVDKPHGLPVMPSGPYLEHTLLMRLRSRMALPELSPAHRLDKDTAGLVLLTKRQALRNAYQSLFRDRLIDKTYEAIAPDLPHVQFPIERQSRLERGAHFMQAVEVAGDVNAITRIAKLETKGALARYRLEPITGQRHQLRAHMAALGAPLLGDAIYPKLWPHGQSPTPGEPLRLLACELVFTDPMSGQRQQLRSGLSLHWPQDAA